MLTRVHRFDVATRLVHWGLAIPFLLLLITGLTNYAPTLKALHVGGFRVFALLHVVLGFAMLAVAGGIVLTLLRSRPLQREAILVATIHDDDLRWVQAHLLPPFDAAAAPPAGKYNGGQKLNALVSGFATAGLLATGVVLGVQYIDKTLLPTLFVESVFPFHTALSLAMIPVILGHLYLALLHPGTRESLRGMLTGDVARDWARRHHPAWRPRDEA